MFNYFRKYRASVRFTSNLPYEIKQSFLKLQSLEQKWPKVLKESKRYMPILLHLNILSDKNNHNTKTLSRTTKYCCYRGKKRSKIKYTCRATSSYTKNIYSMTQTYFYEESRWNSADCEINTTHFVPVLIDIGLFWFLVTKHLICFDSSYFSWKWRARKSWNYRITENRVF